MISNEIDEKKTKYFVIAILLLIVLSVILIIHFNNKSLVSGEDEEKNTTTATTTTEVITTTKKVKKHVNKKQEVVEVQPVEQETVVYKSTIDEEHKLIYNYKLSDEINDTDILKSTILNIDEELKKSNIIGLFDISLYDVNMIKKSVSNTLINISIPLTADLIGYDEYKVVYIDDNNSITKEEFDCTIKDGYIKFSTMHLSKFGIIGIKKEVDNKEEKLNEELIDLTKTTIDIKINDDILTELNNIYIETDDKIDVVVNGLDKEYKLYYLLKDESDINTYQEFSNNIFESIDTPSKFTLFIKLVVEDTEKVFEVGKVNIYDIVFAYDKEEVLEEDKEVGIIKDENGVESNYVDKETNQNIVIDNILKDEVLEEEKEPTIDNEENETNDESEKLEESEKNISNEEKTDNTIETNDSNCVEDTEEDTIKQEGTETKESEDLIDEGESDSQEEVLEVATIKLKGNIYLVEKTDITNLEITGHLIIDTNEDIIYTNDNLKNLYTITIKSREFSLNGVKYTYEFKEEGIVITKVDENSLDFDELFDGYYYDSSKEELVLETYTK